MIAGVSDLLKLLDRYAQGEMTLEAMHDQLSLSLQELFDNASEDDVEMLSKVMAAMYEVEDGVMSEAEFRCGLREMIQEQRSAA
jgi:hypothetical protein